MFKFVGFTLVVVAAVIVLYFSGLFSSDDGSGVGKGTEGRNTNATTETTVDSQSSSLQGTTSYNPNSVASQIQMQDEISQEIYEQLSQSQNWVSFRYEFLESSTAEGEMRMQTRDQTLAGMGYDCYEEQPSTITGSGHISFKYYCTAR